jgi:hypothetical protein
MGCADNFGAAFSKAMMGAGQTAAGKGVRVHQRQQQRQADGRAGGARSCRPRVCDYRQPRGTAAFLRAHGSTST